MDHVKSLFGKRPSRDNEAEKYIAALPFRAPDYVQGSTVAPNTPGTQKLGSGKNPSSNPTQNTGSNNPHPPGGGGSMMA